MACKWKHHVISGEADGFLTSAVCSLYVIKDGFSFESRYCSSLSLATETWSCSVAPVACQGSESIAQNYWYSGKYKKHLHFSLFPALSRTWFCVKDIFIHVNGKAFPGITAARDIKKISLVFAVRGLFMKLVGRITPAPFLTLTH